MLAWLSVGVVTAVLTLFLSSIFALVYSQLEDGCLLGVRTGDEIPMLTPFDRSLKFLNSDGDLCARLHPADVLHCGSGIPTGAVFVCIGDEDSPPSPTPLDARSDELVLNPAPNPLDVHSVEPILEKVSGDAQIDVASESSGINCPLGVENSTNRLNENAKFYHNTQVCAFNSSTSHIFCPPPLSFEAIPFICPQSKGLDRIVSLVSTFQSIGGLTGLDLHVNARVLPHMSKHAILLVVQCNSDGLTDACVPSVAYMRV
jgi:hypothetical protein